MAGASIPAMLVGGSVGFAVAAVAFRVDRRVAERLAALAGDSADPDRPTNLLAALGASTPAMRMPAIVFRRKTSFERAAIERHVLELVELLLAAIEAGLPPATAVERTAGLLHGPLGHEVDRVGREIALGLDWRAALAQSAARSGSDGLAALASALGRAHRLGTSPRTAMRALATELRAERRARAEERARRAPVKMLFPLVLLILPAFLLLTVGPVLLATVRSLH